MSNIDLDNLYRGEIKNKQRFFLAAKLNSVDTSDNSIITSGLNITASEPQFMLCLNRYQLAGTTYHRLYWSNDPNDFVPQLLLNGSNQGAVKCFYKKDSSNYFINYETNLNSTISDTSNTIYDFENVLKNADLNIHKDVNLNIIKSPHKNYNLNNRIYTSVSNDIFNNLGKNQNWVFRKYNGAIARTPLASFTSNNNAFETLNGTGIEIDGTPSASNTHFLKINNFTPSADLNGIPSTGIALMVQGGNQEYFSYSHYDQVHNIITYDKRGLFGTTEFEPTLSNLTITISLDNDSNNFASIKDLVSSYDDTKHYLEIYFIPCADYTYLTGGYHLDNIGNYSLTSNSIKYYSYSNGTEIIPRDISFLTNYLNDTLPSNFSATKFDDSYPLLPVYSTSSTANSSTALLWTNSYESLNAYYYPYCKNNSLCGSCMGLTKYLQSQCHINSNTVENYKNATIAGVDSSGYDAPMSDSVKNSQVNSIFRSYLLPIIFGSVAAVIIIVSLITVSIYQSYSYKRLENIVTNST